ncbi:tocopherol cyclase [Nitzschia inconspicua]|uniref:Tocopherol cyclase n=1 Tax=Nitzschia inconspicua TaxID=303405 RepID=A0A9K3LJB5_9STRA|nr:tocopherol cyclase [Nitzschia inconspicua]
MTTLLYWYRIVHYLAICIIGSIYVTSNGSQKATSLVDALSSSANQNRPFTWPPHSGYHGKPSFGNRNNNNAFFEGWYLRIITESQGSLALIFHIFDPHPTDSERRGVGCQVVTPFGTFRQESKDVSSFRAASHKLDIRYDFSKPQNQTAHVRTSFRDFFRLDVDKASGKITSPEADVEFDFGVRPEVGWGTIERQYSVAGFLASFPVFEPHYQVLLSRGKVPAGGFLKVVQTHCKLAEPPNNLTTTNATKTTLYNLTDATLYLEKNWGGSFPSQWFWIQANTFVPGNEQPTSSSSSSSSYLDLCVTSTGAFRRLPLFGSTEQEEQVALIALHWKGEFFPFPQVDWSIEWGNWVVRGAYGGYLVELIGTCSEEEGLPVSCPTDQGMQEISMETFRGTLRVKLFQKGDGEKSGRIVLDAVDPHACLEIGGLPWSDRTWVGKSAMKEPIKSVAMNVELEEKASDFLKLVSNFIEIPGL